MFRRIIFIILLLLVVLDTSFSFLQHYGAPLDGDIAETVVPAEHFKPLMENALGIRAICYSEEYPNPNRFFVHWPYKQYLSIVPLLLQRFTDPINSVYLSSAIAKSVIQICLIYLLAIAISGTLNMFRLDFMLAAFLVTPMFQTEGYRSYMGIIDPAITYTFSYALPAVILLLYFLPFIMHFYHAFKIRHEVLMVLIWLPLGLITALSGPLNPGIVLVIATLYFIHVLRLLLQKNQAAGFHGHFKHIIKSIPMLYRILLGAIIIFSLYSIYLGQYNAHQNIYPFSLSKLYFSLPKGIYLIITQKPGFPILLLILVVNSIIISRYVKSEEGNKILSFFKWIGLFALIYILLLPLGGFRDYRPYVVRYDTILPITLALIFMFGATTLYIIKRIQKSNKWWYYTIISMVLLVFTIADNSVIHNNECERLALQKISESSEDIVKLNRNCTVLSWSLITDPQESDLNAQLIQKWRITDRKVLYFQ